MSVFTPVTEFLTPFATAATEAGDLFVRHFGAVAWPDHTGDVASLGIGVALFALAVGLEARTARARTVHRRLQRNVTRLHEPLQNLSSTLTMLRLDNNIQQWMSRIQ